jgi:uncharacterized membrane protein (DUF4010 family)
MEFVRTDLFVKLGIVLGLGLLIGLQRERTGSAIGGIRTFPLIGLFGALCGTLAEEHGGWIVAGGLVALGGLLVMSNLMLSRNGSREAGQTTEVAALLLFVIGAYAIFGKLPVVVALGGVVAVLLHFKDPMHAFATKFGEGDVTAIMQFVLVTLVVLPVLPHRAFGPYDTFNPFEIWLMVVLIVSISLIGYVTYKLMGARLGAALGGVVGGLVSSTATTVSVARQSAVSPKAAGLAALVIMIASAVVYARVIALTAVVASAHLRAMLPPLAAMFVASGAISAVLFFMSRGRQSQMPEQGNPANLRVALTFAAIYAVISFAVSASRAEFGGQALYPVALISGLTDVDAITLSSSQLVAQGRLDPDTAWRVILLASLSNLVFKGALVWFLGGRALMKFVAPAFGATLLAGAVCLWLWPQTGGP